MLPNVPSGSVGPIRITRLRSFQRTAIIPFGPTSSDAKVPAMLSVAMAPKAIPSKRLSGVERRRARMRNGRGMTRPISGFAT